MMENVWKKRKIYGLILIIAGVIILVLAIFYAISTPNPGNTVLEFILAGLLAGAGLIVLGIILLYEAWRQKVMYIPQ